MVAVPPRPAQPLRPSQARYRVAARAVSVPRRRSRSDCVIIARGARPTRPCFSRNSPLMPLSKNTMSAQSCRPASMAAAHCVLALFTVALLTACGKDDAASRAAAAAPAAVPVHIAKVEPKRVPIRFDIVGQVEGSKQVEVRARVSGILQKQFYREGDPVKEGARLFELDRAPFEVALAQAKAQQAQATAQVAQTQREETRLKSLVADRAVSRKEYDDSISARQLAEASLQQASAAVRQAELNLSYTRGVAPVSGSSGLPA